MSDRKYTVFVYGSLKAGFGNHRLLEDAEFVTNDSLKGYKMYSMGGFPAIVPVNDQSEIHGEVYQVNKDEFNSLDILEGYPHFYDRVHTKTEGGFYVWVYFHHAPPTDMVVAGGKW